MGRRPEFEGPPNWWWVVYHFFPLQYRLAWTWRLLKPGRTHPMHEQKELQRCFLVWVKRSPKGQRKGGRNSRGFFPPFSLSQHQGNTTLVAAVAQWWQWQQGKHLKLKEENPFLLSSGAVIFRTWSKFLFLFFLMSTWLLSPGYRCS